MKHILFMTCLLAFPAYADSVLWNAITVTSRDTDGKQNIRLSDDNLTFDVSFYITSNWDQSAFWADADHGRQGTAQPLQTYSSGAWMSAIMEDVVNGSSMLGKDSYFFYELHGLPEPASIDYLLPDDGSTRYLAFVLQDFQEAFDLITGKTEQLPSMYYGWLEYSYTTDQGLQIINSAIGLDHQDMIVGAGAVPEPTSGLLLFLGIASLALRRRKRVIGPVGAANRRAERTHGRRRNRTKVQSSSFHVVSPFRFIGSS